jgi:hypothetical protein
MSIKIQNDRFAGAAAMQRIEDARRDVRQALQQWNAADFQRVQKSRKLLEQASVALRNAIDLLCDGDSAVDSNLANGLQPAIVSLRSEIWTLVRMVYTCSTFSAPHDPPQ